MEHEKAKTWFIFNEIIRIIKRKMNSATSLLREGKIWIDGGRFEVS